MKIIYKRVYDALESCGCYAGWAAERLGCPVMRVSGAVDRLLMSRRRECASDVDFEIRKHATLAELSTLESVR